MIGERIQQVRKQHGMTLKQLSAKTNISISFLSDIENGKSNPSLDRIKDISFALDTPVSFFLGESSIEYTVTPYLLDTAEVMKFETLIKSPLFREIWSEIRTFSEWNEEDLKELIAYLKVKGTLRKAKTK